MNQPDQSGLGWTVVLRRQTVQIMEGAEGGDTNAYELVCCECGDHPDTSYHELSAELRQIRGPYPIAAGIAAYGRHVSRYHGPASDRRQAARRDCGAAHPPGSPRSPRSRRGWRNRKRQKWELRDGNGY